jgi:6-phosphofructokinase
MEEQEYKNNIETKVIDIIAKMLRSKEIDSNRAAVIANEVLRALTPNMTIEQINQTAGNFDQHLPELLAVVIYAKGETEAALKARVIEHIQRQLREGKFDDIANSTDVLKSPLS